MTSKRKSFVLHKDSLDILPDLTDEQAGKLFKAIHAYQIGDDHKLDQITKMVFLPFKNQFVRDDEKYTETCERRAQSGAIGGRVTKREQGADNNGESQLYVLRLYNEDEDFIKIGTTTNKINRRFSSSKNMPYEYEIIHQVIGEDVNLEVELQEHLHEFAYNPSIKFPGHTECFSRSCLNKLKEYQPFAQAKNSKSKQSLANVADSVSKSKNKSVSKSKSDSNNSLVEEKPQRSKFKFSDDDYKCAKWMYSLIVKVAPSSKNPNFDSWANTIRLMREADKLTFDDISVVFTWANKDSFWAVNILSAQKFREKYPQLQAKMKGGVAQSQKSLHNFENQNYASGDL